ncbi:NUDIX domain-containing protein [Actinomadura madurae]|uniref:ADP-ribose pyrophosphatase YjhB, NUDIX family n=1 Tax=Actinomadura madurae TaxID=1993 RepID=A0A1I5L178_9ACTN|nr:NUDIX domain-containing protein [Actinomadura madurae]SFO91047.1 ADP-ribose pyrophosphatase YjhB, NUDIX family [Actinomadura madurae]SPT49363.1 ADP-ribose pyrophosphatase [Actinomadura madurae]
MRWKIHSEKPLYSDPWLDIRLADVEITGGRHLDHRLIRAEPGAGAVVVDPQQRVLLEWRHRFITDAWGYEIPIGGIGDAEAPEAAAAREVEEETGWRPGPMRPLTIVHPTPGISDSRHYIFWADGATHVGPPAEDWEAERIDWIPLADIRGLVEAGDIVSGTSMAALLLAASTPPR